MSHDDKAGGFWIALFTDGDLVLVGDDTLHVDQRVHVDGTPANLRVIDDSIWVTNPGSKLLERFDARHPQSDPDVYQVGPHPYSLAVTDDGKVWVGDTRTDHVRLVQP
jgi:streptogramin lyase